MVNEPSITAARNTSGKDEFTYTSYVDLRCTLKADALPRTSNNEKQYIAGTVTIKNIRCNVTFIPVCVGTKVKYDIRYEIVGGSYPFVCSQITYILNEKTRKKTIVLNG